MRCPTKYLRGRISNYNNNNGVTAETDESSDSYISDWNKCISSSGTAGGESEFPGSFDTSGSVRTSNLYLASVRIFPFSSLISHNALMGTQSFPFSLLWSPFHPREVGLFVPFPKLRLGTSFILQTTRSRFCLHSNQGSFTCIHVSSGLSPKRSNANCSVPGKSLQTGRTSQQ